MKRCRHDIAAKILEVIAGGEAKISRIALEAGLPLDRAKKIVIDMESRGLVYRDPTSNTYFLTHIGYEWLHLYRMLEERYSPPTTTLRKRKQAERE